MDKMMVAVRLRGSRGINQDIEDTMAMLNLHKKYFCSIVKLNLGASGMLHKAKDFITWGEASEETVKMLMEKFAEKDPKDPQKTKKFFRLHPPRGGFRKGGIKRPYANGGDLGYRGEKINELIKRMSE